MDVNLSVLKAGNIEDIVPMVGKSKMLRNEANNEFSSSVINYV